VTDETTDCLWVDPKTGEIVQPGTDGAIRIDAVDLYPEVVRPDPDAEWLGDYVTRRVCELDAQEAALKLQHQRHLARLRAERWQLAHRYDARLRAVVEEALKGSKKKSVSYAFGRAGFRKTTRVNVTDEAAALEWAAANAPSAVKVQTSLLKSELPKGAEVPGVERKTEQVWFVRPA